MRVETRNRPSYVIIYAKSLSHISIMYYQKREFMNSSGVVYGTTYLVLAMWQNIN